VESFHALPSQIWLNRIRDVNDVFVFACFLLFGVKFDVNLCNDLPMRGKIPDFRPVSRVLFGVGKKG